MRVDEVQLQIPGDPRVFIWGTLQQRHSLVEVLLYVHRNRRLIRDGSPGRPPRLLHSSWARQSLAVSIFIFFFFYRSRGRTARSRSSWPESTTCSLTSSARSRSTMTMPSLCTSGSSPDCPGRKGSKSDVISLCSWLRTERVRHMLYLEIVAELVTFVEESVIENKRNSFIQLVSTDHFPFCLRKGPSLLCATVPQEWTHCFKQTDENRTFW